MNKSNFRAVTTMRTTSVFIRHHFQKRSINIQKQSARFCFIQVYMSIHYTDIHHQLLITTFIFGKSVTITSFLKGYMSSREKRPITRWPPEPSDGSLSDAKCLSPNANSFRLRKSLQEEIASVGHNMDLRTRFSSF